MRHIVHKICFILLICNSMVVQSKNIYLFPGQGSDQRLFGQFEFPEDYQVHNIVLPTPDKRETMHSYALRISEQIDTTGKVIFIGTSLGGMICAELEAILKNIDQIIIISSAKSRNELPFRYRFQYKIPIYKIVPKSIIRWGAFIAQPIVEPDRKHNKDTFKSMLRAKDALYMKRTVSLIIQWQKQEMSENIIHIHGEKDHTIPVRNVQYDYLIKDGSHMMTLTRGKELSHLVNTILVK